MNAPEASPATLCQGNRVEPLSAGRMTTEPFAECVALKEVKSIIPDSFDDDQCVIDVATRRKYPSSANEVKVVFCDGIKRNVDSLILSGSNLEMTCLFSGSNGKDVENLLPDGNKKGKTL